jgi:NAD(P)-dependent dehydrogenase (short-subunit alcohol dehydrogenase family)
VLVGRDPERLKELRSDLRQAHGDDRFATVVADLGSLRSVADAVGAIRATEERLDVVVDNAGAMFPDRLESADGIEATLAVLAVGPFALVSGLLDLLRRTPGSRVIGMSSGGMYTQPVVLDDLNWERRPFSGPRAYAMAKRVQVTLGREWARRIPAAEVTFVTMHPGWADTPGLEASLPGFRSLIGGLLRTPDEGIDSLVWLATAQAAEAAALSGSFIHDRRRRPFDRLPGTRLDRSRRRQVWDAMVRLARIPDPAPRDRVC